MLIRILFIISILLIQPPQWVESVFDKTYDKIKNKGKDYYKTHLSKEKTWNYLGYDSSEYPGTKAIYRERNEERWKEYYDCLRIQNDNIGLHQTIIPETVQAVEGSSTSFDCKICLSPKERIKIDVIEWLWAPLEDKNLIIVEYTDHIILETADNSLRLYNLRESQTGQYICKMGESLTAPYFLTVVNSTVNFTEVHTENAPQGPYPEKPQNLPQYSLIIDTKWDNWSPCSKCGSAGKRHRFGHCFVIMQDNPPIIRANIDQQIAKDLELFKVFRNGISCLSHVLPESIKKVSEIQERKTEIMTGYCKVPCAEQKIFEVRDKNGNIIEKANNSAGIYSMLQGIPQVEPAIEKMLQYETVEKHVVISCPGNLNTDTPIQWHIASKKVVSELLAQQSNGRIYVSAMDRINIKKAKISDSNIYSCWQNNELAGTVRLVVEKKHTFSFNHHLMLAGMVITLSVFLYTFTRAFLGRKYARIPK